MPEQQRSAQDLLNADESIIAKMPSGLNVLTILTFIGCSLFALLSLLLPLIYDFALNLISKAASSGKEFSAKELAEMEKSKVALELARQNEIPIMIISLVGIALCFIGALWMRKYKKDGFWIYTAGQLLPLIGSALVMGTSQYSGVSSIVFGIGIPLIFIGLYATQRKYLVR